MKASVLFSALVAAAGFAFGYDIPANTTVNYTDIAGQLSADEVVNVGANAIFDLNEQAVTLRAVTGFGTVSNGTLTLTLAGGPYVYAGRIFGDLTFARTDGATDDEFGFVLGASDTLAGAVYTEPNCAGSALRFAAGLGKARIYRYACKGGGQVLDTDDLAGNPVSVTATFHDSTDFTASTLTIYKLVAKGSGDVFTYSTAKDRYTCAKGDSFKDLTGWIGPAFGRFQIAGAIDLSSIKGIHLGGAVDTDIYFYIPAGLSEVTIPMLTGIGQTDFRSPVTLTKCTLVSSSLLSQSTFTLYGGAFSTVYGKNYVGPNGANAVFNMYGGVTGATFGLRNRSDSLVPGPKDGNWANAGRLNLYGGDVYYKQALANTTYVYGGAIHLMGVMSAGSDATPNVIHFDGGRFVRDANTQNGANGGAIKYENTSKDAFQMWVGERRLDYMVDSISAYYPPFIVNHLIKREADVVDGGVLFSAGIGSLEFTRPMLLKGPVALKDGVFIVGQTAEGPVFGSGALSLLGSGTIKYSTALAAGTIALAAGEDARLTYDGAWNFVVNGGSGFQPQDWTIGPADAESSSLVRNGKGAVIYLRDETTDASNAGTVKVAGGMAVHADGRVKDPVFVTATDSALGCAAHGFATYADADGFKAFEDYTEGVEGGAASVAKVSAAKATLAADAAVAALRVDGIAGIAPDNAQNTTAPLVIPSGTTLSVGNGSDPACVILNSKSGARSAIKGEGTLAFGASEGVIVANQGTGYAAGAIVNAKISGSAGLTLSSVPTLRLGSDTLPVIYLGSANDYSGGTWISSAQVIPGNDDAFGTGDVYLSDSQSAGGRIYFATEGVKIANNLHIAGRGTSATYTRWGAIVLSDDVSKKINTAEISGDVELIGRPRVMAHRNQNGSTLTFSGTLYGNDFEAWNAANAYHEDVKIVFTKPNVYTGLTQVIRQNLWLKEQGNTGTGGVELDGGKLVVDADVPTTIRGTLSGVGTVVLKNKKAVTFEAFPEDGYSTLTLDVAGDGKRREVSSVRGFSAIVNSTGVPCDLYVHDLSGFEGVVDPSVNLIEGTGSKGLMLIVR